MAVVSGQVALNSSTATLVVPAANTSWPPARNGESSPGRTVVILNTAAQTIYIGATTVTSGTGYPLPQNSSVTLRCYPDEAYYGISASATPTVFYIESGS